MVRRAEDIAYVRDEITGTLARFAARPVDAARLEAVKRHTKYAFLMGLDSPEQVGNALSRIVALTGGIEAVDRFYEQMEQVTPDDILRATQKYFDARRRTVAVLKGTP
jgi:zinc protease